MNVKNSWKRVVAGMLAVLVMAATVPAGTDFGGVFGGSGIVASADTSEQSETFATNQRKTTYNGTNVTITAQHAGSSYGMVLSTNKSATISVADGYQITKVEFTKGNYDINQIRAKAGNVTISGDVATVSDVNAQSLTVNGSGTLQIKQVKVYYEPVSAEQSTTIATNQIINTYTGTNVTITAQHKGNSNGMYLSGTRSATISVADGYQITKVEFTNGFELTPITRLSSAAGNVTISGDVATVSDVNAQSLTVNGTDSVYIKQVKVYYTEKTEWAIGESINLDGKWFIADDMGSARVHGRNSSAVVPKPSYEGTYGQWIFENSISVDQVSFDGDIFPDEHETHLCLKKPSDKTSADIPSGFKIKSGSGTQADPYSFELVYPSKVDVTGVDLNKTTAAIPYGGTETLTATVAPDGATDKTVSWSSSNTSVATVDENGVVTAVALGTATITATATNGTDDTADDKTATCEVTVGKADPTVKTAPAAVAGLTYNGEPQDLITAGTSEDGTVQYAVVETDGDTSDYTTVKRDSIATLALADVKVNTIYTPDPEGEYQGMAGVYFSIGANYIIDDITYTYIGLVYNPGDSKYYMSTNKGALTIPEGCDGLLITDIDSGKVYAEIVNTANPAGEVEIDEEAWVESIPKETDAGEYNVYYRVKGDANHNDSKPTKIDGVKIAKADATVTAPEPLELTYTGEAQALVTEGTATGGTMMYAVNKDSSTEPTLFTNDIPSETNAGTYYVWYTLDGEDNYNDTDPKYVPVTISKVDPEVTDPTGVTGLVYDGTAKELLNKGSTDHGQMQYAVGTDAATEPESADFGIDVPEKTDAGTYYVWYRVIGDTNHNDTKAKCIAVTIDKADQSPSAKTLTYTAQPQELVNPGKALTGKMLYAVNTDPSAAPTEGYSEDVPTETNAGQYYVWFKLTGNGNYKDSTPICIPVEIKKVDATVTADNITKNCGREDPELTYTAKGLLEGDTLTGALAREAGETAGKYKITQGTLTNENYNITFTGAEFTIEATQVNRLSGANRYETAVAISSDNFEKADTVILTNAQNYADGIAGVPLASKLNAPILLTAADKLNDKTLEEIKRLGAKNVIILGGESAVSADVAKALEDENYVVERLEGKSRFSTAAAIAQKVNENPTDIFFVYGMGFADTLSVSSVAALKNAPIVYLTTDGELNADTAAYLAQLKEKGCVKNAYVIGGTSVISDDMMNKAAQALGLESATRIAGANRYETSAEVNKAFADLFENDEICVATGVDFPDAVTGGVYAASKKAPFILVSSALTDSQKEIVKTTAPKTINVFGGTGAVSDETVKAMIDTLAQPQEGQAPSEEVSEKE